MEHKDTRKLPRSAQEALREKVVRAVVVHGQKQREAARQYEVSENSVSTWVRSFKASGPSSLKTKKIGRPQGKSLSADQARSIKKTVIGKCPDQLRLPGMLWTREAVSELVEMRFGLRISRWTIGRYLRSWGMTPQKPAHRALEQNPVQVREWLEKEYPSIVRQARKEKGQIWWGDETGLRSDHQTGTTWGNKGETPIVRASGQRVSCNMISAITNQGGLAFMVFAGRLNAVMFVTFLSRLIRHRKEKVFLILDRYAVHTSKKVREWESEHQERIRIFYLPAYSPELNPDELLNQDLKRNALRQRRPSSKEELMCRTRGFLRSKQKLPAKVKRYFEGKYVLYAKAA
jgi:transposase